MKNLTSSITWSSYPEYPRAILSVLQAILSAKFKAGLISETFFLELREGIKEVKQGSFEWPILGTSDLSLTTKLRDSVLSKISRNSQEAAASLCFGYSSYALALTAKELLIRRELSLLLLSTEHLTKVLLKKSEDFTNDTKYARDHLKDAGQIRFSTVFKIFAQGIISQSNSIASSLSSWNTNYLTAHREGLEEANSYSPLFHAILAEELEKEFETPTEKFSGYLDSLNFGVKILNSHALLQGLSTQVWRIANDLRIMASGPRGGLSEITLPAVAPGSSIMPGKLNPVIAEMIYGTCDQVDADHAGISASLKSGWLETTATSSISLKAYLQSIQLLRRSIDCFTNLCISGIEINKKNRSQSANQDKPRE